MKKKLLLVKTLLLLMAVQMTFGQNINSFESKWYNTYSSNYGIFFRGLIDNNDLVISGSHWPSWPNGTTDQMISKVNSNGNLIFQKVRSPGGDHDGYAAVVKLNNGNYGFFGQQNAQGTQYFDGFYTVFDNNGNEITYNFFSVPGSSSGSDMQVLPNGNLVFTGNHGGGSNYVAITDQMFNQINYKTFFVGGWNSAQIGIDRINNFIYGIGSEANTSSIRIEKYDLSLNNISSITINHTEPLVNYDVLVDGSNLLLCGYKKINGVRYGTFYKINSNGIIIDSFTSVNNSEFTAINKFRNDIIIAKSNLSGTGAITNELIVYKGSSQFGNNFLLHSGSPFVPSDIILNSDTLYAIGVQGPNYLVGIPAVEKILIDGCTISETRFNASGIQNYNLPWGQIVNYSGYYSHLYQNSNGCDSLVTAYITINLPPDSTRSNIGVNNLNPQRNLHVNDVMRLEPRNSPPENPTKGDMYFDGILNKLRVYDGTTWKDCWQ